MEGSQRFLHTSGGLLALTTATVIVLFCLAPAVTCVVLTVIGHTVRTD